VRQPFPLIPFALLGYIEEKQKNKKFTKVAVAQGLLIAHILKHQDLEGKGHVENQTEALMRRLGNVNWGADQEYIRRKHFL